MVGMDAETQTYLPGMTGQILSGADNRGTRMPGTTTDFWNGTGNWTVNLTDWSLSSPPTSAEDAEIQTGSNTLTATQSIASLQVDSAAVLALQTGGTLTASGAVTVAGDVYMQNGASASVSGNL